eukprot:TRINITY_DN10018_c0_g1_i6.p1 TRINITY_DN10018_c0_g1~~TRINITY_DN10018_c0_g1_i6.p1  ORF type:complete len:623 (+),score=54.32 TRINITY_DN10018_c0_g1_i6:102-1970(+)
MASTNILELDSETHLTLLLSAGNFICIAIYIGVGACAVSSWKSCSGVQCSMFSRCKAGVTRVLQSWRVPQSRFEHKVQKLIVEARRQRALVFFRATLHILVALFVCWHILVARVGAAESLEAAGMRLRSRRKIHASGSLLLVGSMLFWFFPQLCTGKVLHVFEALYFVALCQGEVGANRVTLLTSVEAWDLGGGRFLAAIIVGTPASTGFFNALFVAFKMSRYVQASTEEARMVSEGNVVDLPMAIFRELFGCMVLWLVSKCVWIGNDLSVRAELKAKQSSAGETTVNSILAVLCDAVVNVNKDLLFRTPAANLGQYFLQHPACLSHSGRALLDLVEERDRNRVREQIAVSLVGGGSTLSVATSLLHRNGSLVKVQMYCTCFLEIDDERAYVIGILETKDANHHNTLGRPDAIDMDSPEESLSTFRGRGALHLAASENDGDTFEAGTQSGTSTVSLPMIANESELELVIDLGPATLPILTASTAMKSITGPLPVGSCSFLGFLSPSQAPDVVRRISAILGEFAENQAAARPTEPTADVATIFLRTPHARRAGFEYKVDMSIDMSALAAWSPDDPHVSVCLRFSNVRVMNIRRRRKNRRWWRRPSEENTRPELRQTSVVELTL